MASVHKPASLAGGLLDSLQRPIVSLVLFKLIWW